MREYNKQLKHPSRALRKDMTDAEQLLWSRVRRKQLWGVQFYRQKPLGDVIVDFYAPAARLVIEVDGSQHFEPEHGQRDIVRDDSLAAQGLVVLRFDNRQVLCETDEVVERILEVMQKQLNPPWPPFVKGGNIPLPR